jgi:hypothetical protein
VIAYVRRSRIPHSARYPRDRSDSTPVSHLSASVFVRNVLAQPFQSPAGSRLDSRDRVSSQPGHGVDIAVDQSLRDYLQGHLTGPPMLVFERVDHCRRRGLVPCVQHRSKRPSPYQVTLGAESELDPPRAVPTREERHQLGLVAPVHLAIKTHAAVHQPTRPPALDGLPNQHGRLGVERQVEVVFHDTIIAWQQLRTLSIRPLQRVGSQHAAALAFGRSARPHLFHHAAQGLGDRLVTMPPPRGYRRNIVRWQHFALTVIIVP